MRYRSLVLFLLLVPGWLLAAPPELDIPAEIVATSEYVTLQPKTDAKAITYIGQSGVEPFPAMLLKDARSFVLPTRGLPAARYKFVAVASLNDEHTRVDFVVVVGKPPPDPVVVIPDPTDPPPVVTPVAGMRVLAIWESDTPLPRAVVDAMNSESVWSYLRRKALKGPDGKTPEVRIGIDDDTPLTNLPKPWQDLRAKLPSQLPLSPTGFPIPHVAIGDSAGSVVFSGPYPGTDAEALALFQKYGGP